MDEGQLDHGSVVGGGLLESCEDAAALFEPADEPLDDVSVAVGLPVELDGPSVAILVGLGRNHRFDAVLNQILVDPVGAVPFVSGQLKGPGNRLAVEVDHFRLFQERFEGLRLMTLTGGKMEAERMSGSVAEEMDFGRKPAAGAA
jgi:hypothetical protein